MYVIKGLVDNKIDSDKYAYFVKVKPQVLFNDQTFEVRVCSASVDAAAKYKTYQEALDVIQENELHNFEVYPVCPICGEDYSDPPAISRKDNKTEICSKCGIGEALMDFIDNIQKNKATNN